MNKEVKLTANQEAILKVLRENFAEGAFAAEVLEKVEGKTFNAVNATLYLNGVVAACFMGSLNYSKDRVVIPRLAISADFRKYSPGYVLLCECMKYVLSKTSIQHIDLCRGTEKYKSDLGGSKYLTLFVEIK